MDTQKTKHFCINSGELIYTTQRKQKIIWENLHVVFFKSEIDLEELTVHYIIEKVYVTDSYL